MDIDSQWSTLCLTITNNARVSITHDVTKLNLSRHDARLNDAEVFSYFEGLKMTCVTLKRPIEVLGSPHMMEHEPMAKRKRCGASFFPTTPPGSRFGRGGLGSPTSPYSGSVGGVMSRSTKRAKRRLEIDDRDSLPGANSPPPVSSFLNATPALSPGKFVIRRLVHKCVS